MGGSGAFTRGRRGRTIGLVLLTWALLVTAVDGWLLARGDEPAGARMAAPTPEPGPPPPVAAPPTTIPPVPTTVVARTAVPSPVSAPPTTGTGTGGVQTPDDVAPPPANTVVEAPEPSVVCESELTLEDAPDAPYNFLCRRGDEPLAWAKRTITLHATGLSADQQTALGLALVQFEQAAGFTVTQVSTAGAAVEMSVGELTNGEGGHARLHYTCTAACAYDHADVVLSTRRAVTEGVWLTTILHELGHVAGLNHVTRASQLMYPTLTLLSPPTYADGDRAGFEALRRSSD